jgi:hypothetical protein
MTVTRTWLILLALSAASTLLAVSGIGGAGLAVAVLALAGTKARLILSGYLGLSHAPAIQTGFDLSLALLLLLFSALAVAG